MRRSGGYRQSGLRWCARRNRRGERPRPLAGRRCKRKRVKPFVIVNPRSANGATGRHFDDISAAVRGAVGEHAHAFTERPMHAAELARRALRDGAELVVAVGGDGTISEVVNGFFEEPRPGEAPRAVRAGAALGILPRGTGGDLRRAVGLIGDLRSCAPRLKGEARAVDVGRIDLLDSKG